MAFEIRVDCPSCRVEGARIETWDDEEIACRLGVPASVRCRICAHAATGRVAPDVSSVAPGDGCPSCGSTLDDAIRAARRCPYCNASATLDDTAPARVPASAEEVDRVLAAWAREEGLTGTREMLEAYFVHASASELFASIARGEPVETTFDVADYLFSGGGAAGGGEKAVMREVEEEAPITQRIPQPKSLRRVGGPREELLALASVAASDGEASQDDQQVLARAAERRGMPPLPPEAMRVWRPNELDPPPTLVDRERVLEEMFQMAYADGQMDDSELRVIRDYARAWGVDPARVTEWIELYSFAESNRFERMLRRFGFFLFPAR